MVKPRWAVAALGCLALLGAAALVLKGCMSFGPPPRPRVEEAFRGRLAPRALAWDFEGRRLQAIEVGRPELPLVVFVHGTPGDWSAFIGYLADPELQAAAHMIAVDRPGFGGSAAGGVEPSLGKQAAALAPLLDDSPGRGGAILVGHSLGGPIIGRLAMDYPQRVGGLVIVAGSCDPALEKRTWYQRLGMSPAVRWLVPDELDRANVEMLPLEAELAAMAARWAEIRVPVTVIQGGRDTLVPPGNADFLERALVHAPRTMMRLPQAGHFVLWEQPELVRGAILRQVSSIRIAS